MIHRDEFRIVAEMQTFTQADLCRETELSPQYVSTIFDQFMRAKLIERVRVGHYWLYALTERGQRFAAKLPAIDPEERCLMLVRLTVTERYMYHNGVPVLDTSEDECPVVSEHCRDCGEEFVNLPVTGRCDDCSRLWHS